MIKTQDQFSIKDKIIAIIGATGTLGSQYVKYLSKNGAKVVIGDIDFDNCKELHSDVKENGGTSLPLFVDNTDEKSIIKFFKDIYGKFGKIDVLINNAQIKPKGFYSPFENYSKKTLLEVIDGNLIGVTIACREACIFFRKQGSGVIVNISSVYGITAADQRLYEDVENIYSTSNEKFSSPVSYAISKAGIVQLTRYLSSYYREKNIRVNCLTPGGVFDDHDVKFKNEYSYRTTIGRMAHKNEYNGAILFLCSDASSYMSGANLVIDGGWTAI
ncbi:MAG: short-chain dehydrogenase [Candidatus Marinimicrobia bacterium]|nr:short-chain dehydrogenase [Candidatus Neomarinimicrobiota bacterium]|tara:strand:+ start:5873 stop:6691 length:819 start_codon:yes stop_codon:yes gene_type:complete